MGDILVENPANQALPHRKQMPSSIPNIDSLEGLGTDGSDEYSTLKKLQRHLEYVCYKGPDARARGLQIIGISSSKRNISRMSNGKDMGS